MSNDASIEKVAQYIDEVKNSGIEVLPPDINLSEYSFSIYNGAKIVLGVLREVFVCSQLDLVPRDACC